MAMTGGQLRASTGIQVNGVYPAPGTGTALRNVRVRQATSKQFTLTFGTGDNEADRLVCQDVAIAAGSSATWDLYTGTDLKDINDQTAAFRIIRYVALQVVDGGDDSGVRVGGAASNEWVGFFAASGDKADIFPDGPIWQMGSPDGVAVGSSTANLKVENLGAVEVTVRVVVGGTTLTAGQWTGFFGMLTYP